MTAAGALRGESHGRPDGGPGDGLIRGRRGFAVLARSEDGQVLPLLGLAVVLLIGAGVLVLWLGASTTLATKAQTAADAAALAGEHELVAELSTPHEVNGQLVDVSPDPVAITDAAASYADRNDGTLVGAPQIVPTPGYGWGYDVIVTVQTTQHLPSSSDKPGAAAMAKARASSDPFSSPSPATPTSSTPACQASSISGPRFTQAPAGRYGFFPIAGSNFSFACEPLIAGRLNAIGLKLKLKLSGLEGYVSASHLLVSGDSAAASAHLCGAAAKVLGLSPATDAQLKASGLVRVPGEPNEVQLTELPGCSQSQSETTSQGVSLGNPNVHLVSLTGGPQGTLRTGLLGGGPTSLNESQVQVACQIHQVAQAENLSEQEFYIALLVGFDESVMGQNTGGNTTDPNASVGVFQQISADGWGTIADELNVTSSAEMFFEGGNGMGASPYGLIHYYDLNPNLAPWVLAQQTQRSGAGQSSDGLDNYGARSNISAAQAMEAKINGGACKNS
jgi:hypothetical protein